MTDSRGAGTTERLIGEDFIEAMLTPQFPARVILACA